METKVRVHIFVIGKVQGVFFRSETRERARELGISGWIRNLMDGRVEAIFEGEKEKVERLLEWLKGGPDLSKVEKIETSWEEYRGEFPDFEIKY